MESWSIKKLNDVEQEMTARIAEYECYQEPSCVADVLSYWLRRWQECRIGEKRS